MEAGSGFLKNKRKVSTSARGRKRTGQKKNVDKAENNAVR